MKRAGFSLLELMMVLLIIVVMAQIAVPYISSSKMATNEAVIEKVLSNMSMASEQYSAENGVYPANMAELATYMEGQQYCVDPTAGYQITCFFFAGNGYTYQASPVQFGQTGSTTYTIQTGGYWVPN